MQIILIIILVIFIWRVYQGTKRGLIDEIGALANILLSAIAVVAIVTMIESIILKNLIGFLVTGIILLILLIAWKVIRFIICSLRVIAKLPILNSLNRMLGLLAGLLEATLISWVILTVITSFDIYIGGVHIIEEIQRNPFVNFLYANNLLHEGLRRTIDIFVSTK